MTSKKKIVRHWNAASPKCLRKICRQEFTANYFQYTKDQFPKHPYNPPSEQVKGKIRNLEVWWGRMECPESGGYFTLDLRARTSSNTFTRRIGITTLTEKELGKITPQEGDIFWLWAWKEERIKLGVVERLHVEVESRLPTDEERAKLRKVAQRLKEALDEQEKIFKFSEVLDEYISTSLNFRKE